jgi:hypothetical protein
LSEIITSPLLRTLSYLRIESSLDLSKAAHSLSVHSPGLVKFGIFETFE